MCEAALRLRVTTGSLIWNPSGVVGHEVLAEPNDAYGTYARTALNHQRRCARGVLR